MARDSRSSADACLQIIHPKSKRARQVPVPGFPRETARPYFPRSFLIAAICAIAATSSACALA